MRKDESAKILLVVSGSLLVVGVLTMNSPLLPLFPYTNIPVFPYCLDSNPTNQRIYHSTKSPTLQHINTSIPQTRTLEHMNTRTHEYSTTQIVTSGVILPLIGERGKKRRTENDFYFRQR